MTVSALRRSFDVYYRDAERTARMDRLNAQFVRSGQLAFDIGAHVGDRTASFRRLGARVVALEPQPKVFRALRLIHGRDPGVTILRQAVGQTPGVLQMHMNSDNPTVSTLSRELVRHAAGAANWQSERWETQLEVQVTTLDALIAQHGLPDFVKIDVEGFEADVLCGLSHAVPSLSFEVTALQPDIGVAAVERLTCLGRYRFNFSLGEDHRLQYATWVDAQTIKARIAALSAFENSGDVYALRGDIAAPAISLAEG